MTVAARMVVLSCLGTGALLGAEKNDEAGEIAGRLAQSE